MSERKEKEKSIHDLNFNPTFFDKEMKSSFVSHLNINTDRIDHDSLYSDENINSDNKNG